MSTNPAGIYILASVLPVLGTVAVAARFYVRHLKNAQLGLDDWTALVGLVGLWGIAGILFDGARHHLFGTHSKLDPVTHALIKTNEGENVKYSWVGQSVTIIALTFIKLSVIFLYRRLFHISKSFSIYSICLMILLVAWGIAFLFATIFQCGTRFWAYWTSAMTILRYCDEYAVANVALCFTDVFIDVMILASPIFMIWKTTYSITRKLQILGIFALGLLSTVAAAVRTYIMWQDAYGGVLGHRDVLDANTRVTMWYLVELVAALIACCLPVLRPLVSNVSVRGFARSLQSILPLPSNDKSSSDPEKAQGGVPPAGTVNQELT